MSTFIENFFFYINHTIPFNSLSTWRKVKLQNATWQVYKSMFVSLCNCNLSFSAIRNLINLSWDTCIKICLEGIVKLQAGMLYTSHFLHKGIPNYDTFEFTTCNTKQLPLPCLRFNPYWLTRSSHFFKSTFASQLILNPRLKLFTRAYRFSICYDNYYNQNLLTMKMWIEVLLDIKIPWGNCTISSMIVTYIDWCSWMIDNKICTQQWLWRNEMNRFA